MLRSKQQETVKLVMIMMMSGKMIQLIAVVAAVESRKVVTIMKKARAAVVTNASKVVIATVARACIDHCPTAVVTERSRCSRVHNDTDFWI
jgi:hypothetical protein